MNGPRASAGTTVTKPIASLIPPPSDHLPGDRGDALDVGLGAGGNRAVPDLLRDATAERDLDLADQVLARVGHLVIVGRSQGDAERRAG
jgi:hypothetical protein